MNDSDEGIRDEAVNLFSTWPNTWPDDADVAEPLLTLAKSASKPAYQAQALRGYLQYLEENEKVSNEDKVAKLNDLLVIAKTADDKRQIISVAGTIPNRASLDLLMSLAKDDAVAEEAYIAATKVAADRKVGDANLRRATLQSVIDKTQNEATKKKASDELKRIR